MSRTSSGVARMSRLVISALTMTLLPEPVAPGDQQVRHPGQVDGAGLARHVAAEGEGELARCSRRPPGSSRIRRSATTLKSLFGISRPTTLLARDRRLDPDRPGGQRHGEVVRERLDPADLDRRVRLHLVLRHDRAGVPARDPAGDVEAGELALDDRGVARVVHAGVRRARRQVVEQRHRREVVLPAGRLRRACPARATRRRSPASGRAPRRGRSRRPSSGKSVIALPGESAAGGGPGERRTRPAPAARAAAGSPASTISRAFLPSRSVVRRRRGVAGASARGRRACSIAAAPALAAGAARALPRSRAPRPNGASSSRTGRSRATTSPASRTPMNTMNAPSGLTRPLDERAQRTADATARAPVQHAAVGEQGDQGERRDVRDSRARAASGPARTDAPGPLQPDAEADQDERQEPAAGPEPRRDHVEDPVRQRSPALEHEPDEDHGSQDHQDDRHERARDVGREARHPPRPTRRRVAARPGPGGGRTSAWSPSRPPPRPGRPSAAASSARTGTARRRP